MLVEAVVDNLFNLSTLYILEVAGITLHRLYPSLQLLYQAVEQCSQCVVVFQFLLDFLTGVDDRCVVATTELFADVWQRGFSQVAAQVHGNLPRHRDILAAPLSLEVGNRDVKVGRDRLHDGIDGDRLVDNRDDILERFLGEGECDLFIRE